MVCKENYPNFDSYLFLCAGVSNAGARGAVGSTFNLLSDPVWNPAAGYVEFRVMVYDTYGTEMDEYLQSANLWVGDTYVGQIWNKVGGLYENVLFDANGTKDYIDGHLAIVATGRGATKETHYKNASANNDNNFHEMKVNKSDWGWYSCEREGNHTYMTFRWFPRNITGNNPPYGFWYVNVHLKAMTIRKESSNDVANSSEIGKTATVTNILSKPTINNIEYTATRGGNVTLSHSLDSYPGYYEFQFKSNQSGSGWRAVHLGWDDSDGITSITKSIPVNDFRFSPNDIAYGGKARLRLWRVVTGGSNVLSTVYEWYSDEITILPIKYPTNPTIEDLGCGKLKIKWDVETGSQHAQAGKVKIYRNSDLLGSPDYSTGYFEWTIPTADINTGTTESNTYAFNLYREPFSNDGVNDEMKQIAKIEKNMKYRKASGFGISSTGLNGFTLKWQNDDGYYCSDYKYRVRITQGGTSYVTDAIDITLTEVNVSIPGGVTFDACKAVTIELEMRDVNNITLSTGKASDSYVFNDDTIVSKITQFTASKGFYPTRVQVNWTVSESNAFVKYLVYRKEYGSAAQEKGTLIANIEHSSGVTSYSIEDMNAVAGIFYTYTVEGQKACGGNTINTIASASNIGYILPFGTVSGRISYSGSQAVQGVTVIAQGDGTARNKALDFSSTHGTHIRTPYKSGMLLNNAFTFQSWVRIRDDNGVSTIQSLMDAAGKYAVEIDGTTVYLSVYNGDNTNYTEYPFTGVSFDRTKYQHISISYQASGTTGTAILYIDGVAKQTVVQTGITVYNFPTANAADSLIYFGRYWEDSNYLNGYLDELRLWNRVLSATEIAQNHNSYLSGKENGLKYYYRFDELDDLGEVYDISGSNNNFNMNHGAISGAVQRTSSEGTIPTPDQLSIKGVTDTDGNYLINTIPYTGDGNTYNLIPMFGIHQFSPNKRPLFFSSNSSTFNNVDFDDVSSFPVNITIQYANSNYPVDSVQIAVDGIAASKDGKVLVTGADGKITVDVPIGAHFITVSKQGHTFVNGGRYPANEHEKYNFQTAIDKMDFTDLTTVRLIGRVAGGQPETDKPLGFGLSKANIGQATVKLKSVSNNYSLNITGKDSITTNTVGKITSRTTFKQYTNENIIEIKTDSLTGEFVAVLPPVPYVLTGVKTLDFEDTGATNDEVDFSVDKSNFNINPAIEFTLQYTDTATNLTTSFASHDSVKITRYNPPVIIVEDKDAAPGAFGDSIFVYTDPLTGANDTIPLYALTGNPANPANYALDVPVLTQKKLVYTWTVQAYEEYTNRDAAANPVIDHVPLAGKEVNIANALAAERLEFDLDTYAETDREESTGVLVLDSTGTRDYKFKVSFPNMAGDHKLAAKLALNVNGKTYSWEKNAILFGQMPSDGNNFVTAGPDFVDIVLHDPPGSNSSAYIEEGSSFTHTVSHTNIKTETNAQEVTWHFGIQSDIASGVGVMVISSVENKLDIETNMEEEFEWTNNNEQKTTITFNQKIATSGDPNYIGSMADVYIGRSINYVFGLVNNLTLYPTAEKPAGVTAAATGLYSLFNKTVNTIDMEFGTSFTYTQAHLLEHQIPQWKDLRNQLITSVAKLPKDNEIVWVGDEKVKYASELSKDHPNFGLPETYEIYFKPNILEKERIDKVLEYNTNIVNWEARIADNEKYKVDLFAARTKYETDAASGVSDVWKDKRLFENLSYDAGISLEKSLEVSYENSEVYQRLNTVTGTLGTKFGLTVNKFSAGAEVHATFAGKGQWGFGTTDTEGNSMKFGYTLSEDESVLFAGKDALSVDVYGPVSKDIKKIVSDTVPIRNLTGFTFRTRAGQTSCPHEVADSTLFYKEGGKPVLLNYGTFRIEYPELMINGQRDTASVENVSAGRDATFILQMSNLSEAGMDVTYQIYPNNATNPDGLILSLDGEPLTTGRQIRVPYGQTLTKTLKVRQSAVDILDYKGVGIRFGSVCDADNHSEVFINVSYTPSSTDVTLKSTATLANRKALVESGKITFTISDYDRTYRNFGCIRFQYKLTTDETWTTLKEYVNDEALYPLTGDRVKIETPTLTYEYGYTENIPSDGEYLFRALAVSKIGTDEVTTSSEEIRVVKDVKAPQALGVPSPGNGILNAGDEISVLFNEDIQNGLLTSDKFSIMGILNADIRTEPTVGLSFTGTEHAFTELPLYTNGSFSIETWMVRPQHINGTLFALGEGSSYISLGFDAAGHAVVSISGETKTSTGTVSANDVWKYVTLSYNRNTNAVSVYVCEGSNDLLLMAGLEFSKPAPTQGKLHVGNKADDSSGLHGAVGMLHFYDVAHTQVEASSVKYLTKSGTEPNLIGLWELEEGEGAMAKDKARARHLTLNTTSWYIYPPGKSLALNGTSQYATIQSGTFPFLSYDDFTVELWFKGANQGAATLLSLGTSAYIGFNAAHELIVTSGSNTQTLGTTNLLDDKWHHLAVSVKRNGMLRAIVDGKATASVNSNSLSGAVEGGNYYLGVKYRGTYATPQYEGYFSGNIDELRVWNSALATDGIVLNKNHKLYGTEPGLKAYYPFENTVNVPGTSIWTVDATLIDMVTKTEPAASNRLSAAFTGGDLFSDISTPMQEARPVKEVIHTFTASNNKIVLNITAADYKVEGVTLYITAKDILDVHNNPSSVISWTAFVNRNPLNWNTGKVELALKPSDAKTFKASISNTGGENYEYFIENLPPWLSVDTQDGVLQPLTAKELTFTISPAISIGTYEASLGLTGTNNVTKILPVIVKITGDKPDWSVNPNDFESSMMVIGQTLIEGAPQEDTEDIIAAFIGNKCVGVVSPKYEPAYQAYFIYMSIWGNAEELGKKITFKLWDASTGITFPLIDLAWDGNPLTLNFDGNTNKGTPAIPVQLNARDAIEQSFAVNTGWNWVSFNVASTALSNANQLFLGVTNGIEIKGQVSSAFSRYDAENNYWTNGTLNGAGIDYKNMYMVKMAGNNTLALPGAPVNPEATAITLVAGWNWISYFPQMNMTVKEALAGLNAAAGDLIKSQTGFAVYDANAGWVGNLESMRPGQGYMYQTAKATSFNYPKNSIITRSGSQAFSPANTYSLDDVPASLNDAIASAYESNLSMIAKVVIASNDILESARLVAKVGNERRGVSEAKYVGDKKLFFLPVYSNYGDETVTFVLENNGKEIPLREKIVFRSNAVFGTLDEPLVLTDANINLAVYPNPFGENMVVSFDLDESAKVRIELINMNGAVIYSESHAALTVGHHEFGISGAVLGNLPEGLYLVRVVLNNKEQYTNVVIKNKY
jgi:hypothetical protein